MKYKSVTEILQDESLGLFEMEELMIRFLSERNMTLDEFMETEEAEKLIEAAAEARFSEPLQ